MAPLFRFRPSYRSVRRTPVRAAGSDSGTMKSGRATAVVGQRWLGAATLAIAVAAVVALIVGGDRVGGRTSVALAASWMAALPRELPRGPERQLWAKLSPYAR